MISKIKELYKNNLVFKSKKTKGIKNLSYITIIFLVMLNIFIITSINIGLHFQTSIVNNPDTNYPHQCRKIFKYQKDITKLKNPTNYLYKHFQKNNFKYERYQK